MGKPALCEFEHPHVIPYPEPVSEVVREFRNQIIRNNTVRLIRSREAKNPGAFVNPQVLNCIRYCPFLLRNQAALWSSCASFLTFFCRMLNDLRALYERLIYNRNAAKMLFSNQFQVRLYASNYPLTKVKVPVLNASTQQSRPKKKGVRNLRPLIPTLTCFIPVRQTQTPPESAGLTMQ